MPKPEPFPRTVQGQAHYKSLDFNRMLTEVERGYLSTGGQLLLRDTPFGQQVSLESVSIIMLFQLTGSIQYPDPTRETGDEGEPVGDADEPDVPWTENAQPVFYNDGDYLYQADEDLPAQTLYLPAAPRNENGMGYGSAFSSGDRCYAKWSSQSGRWHIISSLEGAMRWGKLDENLGPGETKTVSLWQEPGGGWEGWGEDSEVNWENCYAPPLQAGTIPSGTMVLVQVINGRRIVIASQKAAVTPLTDFQVDGAAFKLQEKTRQLHVEVLAAETDWVDIHTGTACP